MTFKRFVINDKKEIFFLDGRRISRERADILRMSHEWFALSTQKRKGGGWVHTCSLRPIR